MKKCLGCNNEIERIDHYVCKDCYLIVKEYKQKFISFSNEELKAEFVRWKRNMMLARDQKYKYEYQLRVIALAETLNEKYKYKKELNSIIDFSNNQTNSIEKRKDEKDLEEVFEEENKDDNVDLQKYESRYKCKDGHRTISKSEKFIDDFLTEKGIRHFYDTEIDDETNFRCDFYLPDYKIYIEHWGYKSRKNYYERKTIKTDYYKKKGYRLIDSDEDTIIDEKYIRNKLKELEPDIFK